MSSSAQDEPVRAAVVLISGRAGAGKDTFAAGLDEFVPLALAGTLGESVWIDVLLRRARGLRRVAVTDVRFPNEAESLRDAFGAQGAAVLHVRVRDPAAPPLPPDAHASERFADTMPVDHEVVND